MSDRLTTRREFLGRGLMMVAAAYHVPWFLQTTATALAGDSTTRIATGKDAPILVVLQLSGGNDSLSMLVPYADDALYRARPGLAPAANEVLRLSDYAGLHPSLTGLKALYDAGQLSIVQGVGYPNPNRSHFRAMDIWHTAEPEREDVSIGWLGRYLDSACRGDDPKAGIALGNMLPLAMQGKRLTPMAFERPEAFRYRGDRALYERLQRPMNVAAASQPGVQFPDQVSFIAKVAMDAQAGADAVLKAVKDYRPMANYPQNELGRDLKNIAAMIAADLPTRVYYAQLGGFDTHAGQLGRHNQLMQQLSTSLSTFWTDLQKQKMAERVLVMTFSEFGRRVAQNASGGTDHGAAGTMLLLGTRLKPGVQGTHPSLTDLDNGDLKYTTDFRSVYATVVEKWMKARPRDVLQKPYPAIDLIA